MCYRYVMSQDMCHRYVMSQDMCHRYVMSHWFIEGLLGIISHVVLIVLELSKYRVVVKF